jgi:hypothetical protein
MLGEGGEKGGDTLFVDLASCMRVLGEDAEGGRKDNKAVRRTE